MTDAERALIEACLARGYFGGHENDAIREAAEAVGAERVTPELKKRLADNFRAQAALRREQSELAKGIPAIAWHKLVNELYDPKDDQ